MATSDFFHRQGVRSMPTILNSLYATPTRRMAALVTSVLVTGVASAAAPVQPAAAAVAQGACANSDFVYKPMSAFPDTPNGRVAYWMQAKTIERAVLCLVNQARAAAKPSLAPLHSRISLKGTPPGIANAAQRLANDAARVRWWGTVADVKRLSKVDCTPTKGTSKCDPHVNPVDRSTTASRVKDVGFGRNCPWWGYGENTYTGAGAGNITPRAAVDWWLSSTGHRANILKYAFEDMQVAVAWGSADPATGGTVPALTYVQMFTYCNSGSSGGG
jgi:hypothetical protein